MQIKKMLDVGTANPIVARLQLGMFELIDFATIEKEDKEKLKVSCFEIVRNLVQAEKAAGPLIDEIKGIEEKIAKEEIKTQSQGRVIETPSASLLDNSRVFLKFSKQALQELASAMGILLKKEFKGPHFHLVLKEAKNKFGDDHIVTRVLDTDQEWLKEINALRNEDEHPKSSKEFITNFDIKRDDGGKYIVNVPRFFNGNTVLSSLEVYSHNLLTFSEEMLAHTLASSFPSMVQIFTIPEEQRDSSCPKRYRIGLSANFNMPN